MKYFHPLKTAWLSGSRSLYFAEKNIVYMFSNQLLPRKLTWNLKITPLKRNVIFQTSILGFHVSFRVYIYIIPPPTVSSIFPFLFFLGLPQRCANVHGPQGEFRCVWTLFFRPRCLNPKLRGNKNPAGYFPLMGSL